MSISTTTIKRLFGLSGNKCAFPDCEEQIIEDGVVLGEICHIEARNAAGPRYNPNSNDEDRDKFENLVLMCGKHHKIIDSKTEEFTVAILKKYKDEHEQVSKKTVNITDEQITQLISNVGVKQSNSNVKNAIAIGNNSAPIIINQNNLDESKIRALLQELIKENLPHLIAEAKRTADERIGGFQSSLLKKLAENKNTVNLKTVADPIVQATLINSQKAVALNSQEWVEETLSNLVLQAMEKDSKEFRKLIAHEASEVVGTLWEDLVKLIALKFAVEKIEFKPHKPEKENFYKIIDQIYLPLLDFKVTEQQLMYLTTKKCFNQLSIYNGGVPTSMLMKQHQNLFSGLNAEQMRELFEKESKTCTMLLTRWEEAQLGGVALTPIGSAIALSYLHKKSPITRGIKFEEVIS